MRCPRCGVEQPDGLIECLACGVVFAKLRAVRAPAGNPRGGPPASDGRWRRCLALLTHVEPVVNPLSFAGRVLVYGVFVVWGIRFLISPVADPGLMASFMHVVDLVFHEAGHVLLMPFGWSFLTSLAGSLAQIAIPLLCAGTLLLKARDPFGASIGLWWTGQSVMDLAPYIGDARALQLPLLGGATGAEVEGHDWEAILGALGWLEHDRALATLAHAVGALLILASLAWGAYVLLRQRERLAQSPPAPLN
jgi:hypothetical protein